MKPRRGTVGLTGSPTSACNASFNKGFAATTCDAFAEQGNAASEDDNNMTRIPRMRLYESV
jgi:hypothetical protein